MSLHLEPGIWGLLGPNGSGKSSFLNLAAGQLVPSLGEIRVCGAAPFANPEVLSRVGHCPEADAMFDELTGLEHVAALAELSGFSPKEALDRAATILTKFDLASAMDRRVGGYSRGMRQRTKLAQALVHDPDVILLDEPLTGTDPISRAILLEELKQRGKNGALVLFSTHVLPEVEALTDRVLLIARGQLVAHGSVREIHDAITDQPHRIEVRCSRARELAAKMVHSPGVRGMRFPAEDRLELDASAPDEVYLALMHIAVGGDFSIAAIESPDANVESLFHSLVDRSSRMAGTGADAQSGSRSSIRPGRQTS